MKITKDDKLNAKEIADLRKFCGLDHDEREWEACLKQNLLNVSARNSDGDVIGTGFLCGNGRHAELVDLVVHPDYRQNGIGREIVKFIVDYALEHNIRYFGLTYDEDQPWLKTFYESEGFQLVDFAMWHETSLR